MILIIIKVKKKCLNIENSCYFKNLRQLTKILDFSKNVECEFEKI